MSRWSYLHEVEIVSFRALPPRPRKTLLDCFLRQGFAKCDDIVHLARDRGAAVWQASATVEVKVNLGGEEKFGFGRGQWDDLQLQYLFAFLPFCEHERFIESVERTSEALQLPPLFRGSETNAQLLRQEFAKAYDELVEITGEEPGLEVLAVLIQDTYPRYS